MDIQDILDKFNSGNFEAKKYFNDYSTWFNILKRRKLLGEIDPINAPDSFEWQNDFLLWLYETDKPKYYYWTGKLLDDIIISGDTIYWEGPIERLSDLFCDNRRGDITRKTVEEILAGENVFEPYWDTTDNVYRDVIEELTDENLEVFKKRIVKELNGQQLSPETEAMELIAAEQGHDEYWELNSENVTTIVEDEESMNSLLGDELSDIKSDLYSLHSNSYNSAYETEIYDDIWKELDDYFVTEKKEWLNKPHAWKKNVMVESFRIPIRDFAGIVNDYLSENKGYNNGTLEYQGSFMGVLTESVQCLAVYPPDYPNSRLVDKNINDYFGDYF